MVNMLDVKKAIDNAVDPCVLVDLDKTGFLDGWLDRSDTPHPWGNYRLFGAPVISPRTGLSANSIYVIDMDQIVENLRFKYDYKARILD